jgi:hypothetical protein
LSFPGFAPPEEGLKETTTRYPIDQKHGH